MIRGSNVRPRLMEIISAFSGAAVIAAVIVATLVVMPAGCLTTTQDSGGDKGVTLLREALAYGDVITAAASKYLDKQPVECCATARKSLQYYAALKPTAGKVLDAYIAGRGGDIEAMRLAIVDVVLDIMELLPIFTSTNAIVPTVNREEPLQFTLRRQDREFHRTGRRAEKE